VVPAVAFTLVCPEAFVAAGGVRVAVAPVVGALKVTVAPEIGLPSASVTVTASGLPKAIPTVALWPPPPVATMFAGAPTVLVRLKEAGVDTPAAAALMVYTPAVVPAIALTVARPFTSVLAGEPVTVAEAPLAGGVNVTLTPETGFPLASLTSATSGLANDAPTVALWLLPPLTTMVVGAPATFVSANVADVALPVEATTEYVPAAVPAVAVTVARPDASVVAGDVANVADGPVPGAAKVTDAPGTGFPSASSTSATSDPANVAPTVALCGLPLLTITVAGAPAVFVRLKLAVETTPETSAVTE
jgi:hypothetical protein